jgi:hypothetical protein
MEQDPAHRVRVQRRATDPPARADASEQWPRVPLRDHLPVLERPQRTGFDVAATRQADLSPLPFLVGLAAKDAQPQPVGVRLQGSPHDLFKTAH